MLTFLKGIGSTALMVQVSNSFIHNNKISNGDGGGIWGNSVFIKNCTIFNNTADNNGGGM